jgi:hypothetical protein
MRRGKAAAKGDDVGTETELGICVYTTCKAVAGTALFLCARGSECSKQKNYERGAYIHAWCSKDIGKVEDCLNAE